MLEQISEILIQLLDSAGYFGLFLATFIESFFPPIPSEVVLITAGFYASSTNGGIPVLILMSFVGALGNFFGTLPFYGISRFGAKNILPKFLKKWGPYLLISEEDLGKAEKYFKKRGELTIFVSRLIPGIRSLISFPAGLSKMNFFRYFVFTLLGSFCWNMILSGVGFLAYDNREVIFAILSPIEKIILGVLVAATVYYLYRVVREVKRIREGK
jgi:membrane protein DedA with SNARE-associated domain